jgi:acetyl-CoA synthetase
MIEIKDGMTESNYHDMYARSLRDPQGFWAEQAEKFITWFKRWDEVLTGDFQQMDVQWFSNGKLNACYNCLDRHLEKRADQIAFLWEGDDATQAKRITYAELYDQVCRFANVLKKHKVKKGDRVCIYMPMIPEVVIAMLACARIGAVHSVVFAGFSADALMSRILDADCQIVITANEGLRGEKIIPLKDNVDNALKRCPHVKKVIVVKRTENVPAWQADRDVWYHEEMPTVAASCPAILMDADDPLFILYTSGSTGKPKGILHTHGGYLVYAAMTFRYVFNYQEGDVYWCTADVGWITGHSYSIYAPLCNGATSVLFEGIPNSPTSGRCWEIIDKYQVSIFYTAPTAIRALRHDGDEWVTRASRKSLRILGTVGEPINPDVWEWYYDVVGEKRCPVVDTWWQTETGGIMISPIPGASSLKPGSAGWPLFGIVPEIVGDQLLISKPWPGMMKTVYGDRKRFEENYFKDFPGRYLTGDTANCDEQGYYWIKGRNDDVIKISGHRIGTEEVESALVAVTGVSEAAVVTVPHDIKGESIYAFVSLLSGSKPSDALKKQLIQQVRTAIGAIATPDYIQFTDALPKTRSGKIMRRLLRKIANNDLENLGDISTLADPQVVDHLIKDRIEY